MIKNENLSGIPFLVVANKQDLPDCLSLDGNRDIFKSALSIAGQSADPPNANLMGSSAREMFAVEASALEGEEIGDSINWIVSCIERNGFNPPPRALDD